VVITGGLGVGLSFSEPVDEQSFQAGTADLDFKLTPVEKLGKLIFFDQKLSLRDNQSCATCHGPKVGWTGPDSSLNALGTVYMGSVGGRFGNRKPPSAAYAGFSPVLKQDETGSWRGGLFWDGRATGLTLGDPLAEQAQEPFLNPLEQALPAGRCQCCQQSLQVRLRRTVQCCLGEQCLQRCKQGL